MSSAGASAKLKKRNERLDFILDAATQACSEMQLARGLGKEFVHAGVQCHGRCLPSDLGQGSAASPERRSTIAPQSQRSRVNCSL